MIERVDAEGNAFRVAMHDQLEPEARDRSVPERDHLPELPRCVHMQQRERHRARVERLAGQVEEDVFVALMAGRIEALGGTLDELDRGLGLPGLLTEMLPQVREIWRLFGRSAQQWESKVLAGGRRSKRAVTSATVFRRLIRSLDRAIKETAAANGQRIIDDPAMAHWVWDALIGSPMTSCTVDRFRAGCRRPA
jgi:hypothetical protein